VQVQRKKYFFITRAQAAKDRQRYLGLTGQH
jgi:hypothetical protein